MIHFSLRQIEYFDAAARCGGAAAAAKALQVSQPSISKAIAELESLWGEQLFVRLHARGLELTAAGALRFRQAHALLRQGLGQSKLLLCGRYGGVKRGVKTRDLRQIRKSLGKGLDARQVMRLMQRR